MNCKKTRTLLSCYLDGEVGDDEKRLLAEHIRRCTACASIKEDYETVGRLLKLNEQRTIQPFLWTRIAAGIGGSGTQQPWIAPIRTPWLSWAAALACTVVVTGFLFFIGFRAVPADGAPGNGNRAPQSSVAGIDPFAAPSPEYVTPLSNPSRESVLAYVLYHSDDPESIQPREAP